MTAETIARAGVAVTLFDRMPSVGRKLLMAGRGGLNLTHSEPVAHFPARYGGAAHWMDTLLAAFPPSALIEWCEGLGQATFIGSSGRVFPKAMKASPLLRAWLQRLEAMGVRFVTRAQWTGWDGTSLRFADGTTYAADAVVLALGVLPGRGSERMAAGQRFCPTSKSRRCGRRTAASWSNGRTSSARAMRVRH